MVNKNLNFLLYNKGSYLTARLLATGLGLRATSSPEIISKVGGFPSIRYGNSQGIFGLDTEFNSPEVIKLCSNSLKFSTWAENNEVESPVYLPYIREYRTFPYLLRRKYHRGGTDIIVVNSIEDVPQFLDGEYYIVPFINTYQEIRIHIVNGDPVKVMIKKDGELTSGVPIRSAYKGWHYTVVKDGFSKVKDYAKDIAEKLNLKFGALDVGRKDKNNYVVWEVNTAPGLNSETIKLYIEGLRKDLGVV